jgi:hypothetical protein
VAKVMPRFMSEKQGLSLICPVLVDASAAWRGVKIAPAMQQRLAELRKPTETPALQAA